MAAIVAILIIRQSAHAGPKPSYDNVRCYAIQITASQF